MLTFDTSYSYDRISLKISGNGILLRKLPFVLQKSNIMVVLSDENDEEVIRVMVENPYSDRIEFGELPDGYYFLNLFTKTNPKSEVYWGYLQNRSLSIRCVNRKLHFVVANVINVNRKLLSEILVDPISLNQFLKPSSLCQSDSKTIIELGRSITQFKVTPMQKILAIHDWVANNIYYDCDSLENRKCDERKYSALDVLFAKKCVCRGFANLGVALMRASGIPAIGISCYSLNISTDGGWEREENNTNVPNHIIAAAFVEKRWVLMDITWDSDNTYENGIYQKRNGSGISRKYFDTTLEMISNTHKFIYAKEV